MSEVSNADIYNVLINMRGDIGRLEGKVDSQKETLVAHIKDDETHQAEMYGSIRKLEMAGARQKGFVAAISTVGAVLGAGIGAVVDYVSRGHH
jgi:hypothetical protein